MKNLINLLVIIAFSIGINACQAVYEVQTYQTTIKVIDTQGKILKNKRVKLFKNSYAGTNISSSSKPIAQALTDEFGNTHFTYTLSYDDSSLETAIFILEDDSIYKAIHNYHHYLLTTAKYKPIIQEIKMVMDSITTFKVHIKKTNPKILDINAYSYRSYTSNYLGTDTLEQKFNTFYKGKVGIIDTIISIEAYSNTSVQFTANLSKDSILSDGSKFFVTREAQYFDINASNYREKVLEVLFK